MEESQYVIVLAAKTGWTEEYIRWELPLARGWSYYHSARLLEGERCRWPEHREGISQWIDDLRASLKTTTS